MCVCVCLYVYITFIFKENWTSKHRSTSEQSDDPTFSCTPESSPGRFFPDLSFNTISTHADPLSSCLVIHCHGGGFVAQSSASHEVCFKETQIS